MYIMSYIHMYMYIDYALCISSVFKSREKCIYSVCSLNSEREGGRGPSGSSRNYGWHKFSLLNGGAGIDARRNTFMSFVILHL